jgi:Asp-tRNA(Asn)/Glu-tRNA(Gln) amidotransferase B subunit
MMKNIKTFDNRDLSDINQLNTQRNEFSKEEGLQPIVEKSLYAKLNNSQITLKSRNIKYNKTLGAIRTLNDFKLSKNISKSLTEALESERSKANKILSNTLYSSGKSDIQFAPILSSSDLHNPKLPR